MEASTLDDRKSLIQLDIRHASSHLGETIRAAIRLPLVEEKLAYADLIVSGEAFLVIDSGQCLRELFNGRLLCKLAYLRASVGSVRVIIYPAVDERPIAVDERKRALARLARRLGVSVRETTDEHDAAATTTVLALSRALGAEDTKAERSEQETVQ